MSFFTRRALSLQDLPEDPEPTRIGEAYTHGFQNGGMEMAFDDPFSDKPLIFELSREGRQGVEPSRCDVPERDPEASIPGEFLRSDIEGFPEVSEPEIIRHYTRLSRLNYGVDTGFYPLGSCTMKYNPKVNEDIASFEGFLLLHPYQPEELCQGALRLMYELECYLAEVSGMDSVTLQPSAGAQGEFCGLLTIDAYFRDRGKPRKKVIVPDTAHGTNPASTSLAGFRAVTVRTGKEGVLTLDTLKEVMDNDTAALMLTNPNTLGLFERHIKEISDYVHQMGGFVYCDGANLNALMGIAKLGEMGVDIVQFNLHKTFSTPHGGGGPGSGPVGVKKILEPYLPVPRIRKKDDRYTLDYNQPRSIGKLRAFYGNFSVMVKAYSYIRRMGPEGLKKASTVAIVNANYIKERLKSTYHLPFDRACMHECVFSDRFQSQYGVTTMDIAKRLIDYGFHPPTIYFPLIVHGAMMIEPTETESPEEIDRFIEAMKEIDREARESPDVVKNAPTRGIKRIDEAGAVRRPVFRWQGSGGGG